MRLRRARVTTLFLLAVLPAQLLAQEKPFTIQVNVHTIEVTARVTDANGQTPADLKASDFVIVEDGVEFPVRSIDYLGSRIGEATLTGGGAAAQTKKPWDIVIYIDLELSGRRTMKDALTWLTADAARFTTMGNVEVVVADPAPRRLVGPTSDAAAVTAALTQISRITPADRLSQVRQVFLERLNASDAEDDESFSTTAGSRGSVNEEGMLIQHFLARLTQWLGAYSNERPRALFLVCDGYDIEPGDFYIESFRPETPPPPVPSSQGNLRRGNPRVRGRASTPGMHRIEVAKLRGEAQQAVRRKFELFAQNAAAAGWTISTMRGGIGAEFADDATTAGGPRAANFLRGSTGGRPGGTLQRDEAAPLRAIANITGGDLATSPARFVQAVESLAQRVRLTYVVSRPPDGRLRRVEVRPKRAGLEVHAAKYVTTSTPDLIAGTRTMKLMSGEGDRGELPVTAKLAFAARGSEQPGTLEVRVPLGRFADLRSQLVSTTLRLSIAVAEGERSAVQHQLLSGYDLSKLDEVTVAAPIQLSDRATNLAVTLEELATGIWGGTTISIPRTEKNRTFYTSAGWVEKQAAAITWPAWNDALRQAQSEKKLIVALVAPQSCANCAAAEKAFDDAVVRSRLAGFVVTRGDAAVAQSLNISADTAHIVVLDAWGRLRFDWNVPSPEQFAARLAQARAVTPSIIRAGELLQQGNAAEAHFVLGFAHLRTQAFAEARNEYATAHRLASAAGDQLLAQRSQIQGAAAAAQAGNRKEAIDMLERITRSPASPSTEAEAWLILGHVRKAGGDVRGARTAYERAAARAAEGSELQRVANTLLAQSPPG